MSLSDKELMLLCAEEPQNESAWSEFFSRFDRFVHGQVLRAVRKYRGGAPDRGRFGGSEDELVLELVQEFYLRLISADGKALRNFRQRYDDSAKAYITVIISSQVCDHFRRQSTASRRGWEVPILPPTDSDQIGEAQSAREPEDPAAGPERIAIGREELERAIGIIKTKSKDGVRDRNLLIAQLAFGEGRSAEEISRCKGLQLSPRQVRNVKSQLAAMIRGGLEDFSAANRPDCVS